MGFLKEYAGNFIRHGLTILAGYLVHKGWVDANSAASFVSSTTDFAIALLSGLGAVGWSIINSKL